MPARIHEFGERQDRELKALSAIYASDTYWPLLKNGQLTRPAIVRSTFFSSAHLERVFSVYQDQIRDNSDFSPELKIVVVEHSYQQNNLKLWWPWACGLKTEYKSIPVIFPYFSNSRFIMLQPFDRTRKLEHLRITLLPVLEKCNILIDFDYKPNSLTHELIMQACSEYHVTYHTSPHSKKPNQTRSQYWLTRTREELKTLHEKSFISLIHTLRPIWCDAAEESVEDGYQFIPNFVDQLV